MSQETAARVVLRMSPQLRDALRASALESGCSLNQFAIQVLASAAGHRARSAHAHARERYRNALLREMTMGQAAGVIRRIDESEPWLYVEREMGSA